jgi:hypothetical protein
MKKSRKQSGRPEKYTNWWQEDHMNLICSAMKLKKNATKAIKHLQGDRFCILNGTNPFMKLPRSNLIHWFDQETFELKPQFQQYRIKQSSHGLHNKKGILENEEVEEELRKVVRRQNQKGKYHHTYIPM